MASSESITRLVFGTKVERQSKKSCFERLIDKHNLVNMCKQYKVKSIRA